MREVNRVRGEGETVGFSFPAQFFAPLSFCKESGIQDGFATALPKRMREGATVGRLGKSNGREQMDADRVYPLEYHSYPEGRAEPSGAPKFP